MWQDGEIGPDTLVWTEGMGRRARVRDMPTLLGILRGDEDEDEPVGGRGAGLDQLLADAAEADGERVTDGATTSFGDAALLDAELGSDASSWELNGSRQRAAAAAAAAGRSSPALVLTLLRELQATQERCGTYETRESTLARDEADARALVKELRALATEAREASKGLASSSPFDLVRLVDHSAADADLALAQRAAMAADAALGVETHERVGGGDGARTGGKRSGSGDSKGSGDGKGSGKGSGDGQAPDRRLGRRVSVPSNVGTVTAVRLTKSKELPRPDWQT